MIETSNSTHEFHLQGTSQSITEIGLYKFLNQIVLGNTESMHNHNTSTLSLELVATTG